MNRRAVRSGLFLLSAASYSAWLTPLGASSHDALPSPQLGTFANVAVPARLPALVVRRDPFAGEPSAARALAETVPSRADARERAGSDVADAPGTGAGAAERLAATDAEAPSGFDFAAGPGQVPNIGGTAAQPDGGLPGVSVKATIVGRRAVAYVQNGAVLDIVRVGDRLGSRTIVRIELRGIVFDDGSRLDLADGLRPAPAATAAGSGPHALTLRELERALAPLRPAAPLAAPPGGTAPPAGATPPAVYATPGPLPTVDARGRRPDEAPTSDPRAATPYPVPGIDR